jgi:5-methylthioadenosine/S-adenosylhomocysteine deaminase
MIFIDIDQPHLAPLYDPATVLVYNANGRDVTHVMVKGKFLVENRELVNVDMREILDSGNATARSIWREAGLGDVPAAGLRGA